MNFKETYWGHNGKHQELADALIKLIPIHGAVVGSKNKCLEKLRNAINCYHDLYTNGLGNRKVQFNRIFKVASNLHRDNKLNYYNSLYEHIEPKMDEFILAAAIEQGLK
jgi:hypothetical protein